MRLPPFSRYLLLPALVMGGLVGGCYQVPVTGRRAVNLVDSQQVVQMSVSAFEDMKKQYRISNDRERTAQLNRVGQRISQAVFWDMPNADWEFVLFDVPDEINAFAMSGGKVGVFSGLFKIVENDAQLAAVISHEIAHVTAKHVDERFSQAMAMETLGVVGGTALAIGTGGNELAAGAVMGVYGFGLNGTGQAWDREKEAEADHIGLIYMAEAGYDPREAIKIMNNLEEEMGTEAEPVSLNSTHPSNPERIRQMQQLMPEALRELEKSGQQSGPRVIE